MELAALFNSWLVAGDVLRLMRGALTTLIPKSCDETAALSIKNWRPISVGSVIYRTFMGGRMFEACPPHPRQRGFIQGPGCAENISIIKSLHTAAKCRSRSFGAEGLDRLVIELFMSAYKDSHTRVKTIRGSTVPSRIESGVKQGDPLSPILFNLCLDPLMYLLEKEVVGIQFAADLSIPSIAYADDLVVLGETYLELQKGMHVLSAFLDRVVLQGESIHAAEPGDRIKYLGVHLDPWAGITTDDPMGRLNEMLEKVGAADLKPTQKLFMLKQYIIPRFVYCFDHGDVKSTKLQKMDRLMRFQAKELRLDSQARSLWRSLSGDLPTCPLMGLDSNSLTSRAAKNEEFEKWAGASVDFATRGQIKERGHVCMHQVGRNPDGAAGSSRRAQDFGSVVFQRT
ncbi:hypothetical protein WMY93_029760 [Mugilogobius chulae]|uniref:Reverse transcriptase domain-containing protein n=1 Tax=Mugilogobius chulae TaxID=88201 RepID=A0AAW0MS59_9GOBI